MIAQSFIILASTIFAFGSALCTPGDRSVCNNRGSCTSAGNGCECDDNLHYWPSEHCLYRHEGRELRQGQFCFPNTVDYYCSWMGSCNEDGSACNCNEPAHRSSTDRCLTWSGSPSTPLPTQPPSSCVCSPGDRGYCNNRGACDKSGDECICDDSLHYWPSEQCSVRHDDGELRDGQCCRPGVVDGYCSWLGVCNAEGSGCVCFDADHRTPSERCAVWHEDLSTATLESTEYSCRAPQVEVSSECTDPLSVSFDARLAAYETTCTTVAAHGTLSAVNITVRFDDVTGGSSPADLQLSLRSLFNTAKVSVGGWDSDDRDSAMDWPAWWQAVDPGFYTSLVDLSGAGLSGAGHYEICLFNKYIASGEVIFKGQMSLLGLNTDCGTSLSPTATPVLTLFPDCDSYATIHFDVSLGAKQKVCSNVFEASGEMIAVNVNLEFSSLNDSVSEWPADLELEVRQVSSDRSFAIGFDPKDNQFYDDDNENDPDGGAVFRSLKLKNAQGNMLNLMSADLWLSPSSNLTAHMETDVESCDGSFCATFQSDGIFKATGNAQANNFYPRYVSGPLTAPFHMESSILRDYSCDDHFFVLSADPLGSTFSYTLRPNTVSFAWDCKRKFIYGPTAKKGVYCGPSGYYELVMSVDAHGMATFSDNVCESLTLDVSGLGSSFYLFIGSDTDAHPGSGVMGDDNDIVQGVFNKYKLEWPHAWMTSASGSYASTHLMKTPPFNQASGSYQVCLTNTWKDAEQSSFQGQIELVGTTSCVHPVAHPTPAPSPTSASCTPGDRNYCNQKGVCVPSASGCECDDVLHYWASERCSKWHNGRQLESGKFCYPGTVDYYCSWLGSCSADGSSCECYDSVHRSSSDRCKSWTPATVSGTYPPTPAPAPPTSACNPGDRAYCNNRGACSAAGDSCSCDDNLHYWSSERCSTYHHGGELPSPTSCCEPNTIDYYCSWLGACDSSGTSCLCFDNEHRSSHDRCQTWYSDLNSSAVPSPPAPGSCPALLSIPDESSDTDKKSSSKKSSHASYVWVWYVLCSAMVILVIAGAIMYRSYKERLPYGRDSSVLQMQSTPIDGGSANKRVSKSVFTMENPARASSDGKRLSLSEKIVRVSRSSVGYDEVDDGHDVVGMVAENALIPSEDGVENQI